ncbi:glycoside hydrolase family 19 protein [Rhizorhabdus histidinilytica]|uniref:Putative chitinase n=1 Tax=Rhizorhabdus histidinilytica TaxID=439228 RepID=A0A1T5BQK4_9SPHN|nr:glycoside hydrolase family 19 protein [Rhizorhabdus histidinilytica]SKB49200.1 putative chitinase [Rhizorhabdus histidinilytica]
MIDWKPAQRNIGVTPDGIIGPNTMRALLRRVSTLADATPDQGIINSLATAALVHLPAYGLTDSRERLAWALAETANETGGYTRFEENLNYSAGALVRTWPNRFNAAKAARFARQPEAIANEVYGGRMGNDQPGDGWAYRGRGMLQLTGKANYLLFDKRLGIGLDTHPEIAAVPALSLLIACEFYRANGVLAKVDAGDLAGARRITNGGLIGLDHVKALFSKIMGLLS